MTVQAQPETLSFQAEAAQVLDLVVALAVQQQRDLPAGADLKCR